MRPSDLKKLAPSIPLLRRNMNLLRNFDADWYVNAYPDAAEHRLSPLMHFIRYGLAENRQPSSWFDASKLPVRLPKKRFKKPQAPKRFLKVDHIDQKYLDSLVNSETLWVFFNVATTTALSGGMLSINRFADVAIETAAEHPSTSVVISGVPLTEKAVEYTRFKQRLPMLHLLWLAQNTDPLKLKVFLPEVFSKAMIDDVFRNDVLRYWFKSRPNLEIIVLNQNNELMPEPEDFNPPALHLTKSVTIATAHPRYCTKALAVKTGLPVKQLTPILPDMARHSAVERKPVFMVSPDVLDDAVSGLTQQTVVDEIQELLPEFEIVVVENLTLAEYLDLASRTMFSITFGEGMDGYFIEPILSGGVSFAVYNDIFFPKNFIDAPTVAQDWSSLMQLIKENVPKYLEDPDLYDRTSSELQELLRETYSREISKKNFEDLVVGVVDHAPSPQSSQIELFDNLREYFEKERDFRFHNGKPGEKQVVSTPDNLIVQHLGSEFYSVLYEIYERRDYDLLLDQKQEYVLIDIGANVGMASLYLRNRYTNIKKVFAYEPLSAVADIARTNFKANPNPVPIELKQIGLSDEYSIKTVEFFEDWTTAFSTDNQKLDSFLKHSEEGSRTQAKTTEVEVAPASVEVGKIIDLIGEKRIALKCDTQGSEFAVFRSLELARAFDKIDAVVVETHFEAPDEIIQILERNGFKVNSRCDHESNNVYTIKASRLGVPE